MTECRQPYWSCRSARWRGHAVTFRWASRSASLYALHGSEAGRAAW